MYTTRVRCLRCNTITRVAHPYFPYLGGVQPYVIPPKVEKTNSTDEMASPSQTQRKKDDSKPNIVVSGNQISGNEGDLDHI